MSNQIGLMLSFILLTLLILFSGELISYQTFNSTLIADTAQFAHILEKQGYDERMVDYAPLEYNFYSVDVDYSVEDGIEIMKITTARHYNSITKAYNFFEREVYCHMTIYR